MDETDPGPRPVLTGAVIVVAVVLGALALRATAVVSVPVVAALLIALAVAPADSWLASRMPRGFRWAGHALAMGIVIAVILVFAGVVIFSAQQLLSAFPLEDLSRMVPEDAGKPAARSDGDAAAERAAAAAPPWMRQAAGTLDELGVSIGSRITGVISGSAEAVVASGAATLAGLVLIFFLALFMLVEGEAWCAKVRNAWPGPLTDRLLSAGPVVRQRLRQYLWARLIVGLLTAACYVAWLALFGVDLLFVWGVLAVVSNFVPNVGAIVAGVLPTLYAFATRDFGTALWVAAGLTVVEQIMGNFVDPKVQGDRVHLSPAAIFLFLLFWSFLWGIPGALLATPILICLYVVSARTETLRPLALLLSDKTEGSKAIAAAGETA